MVKNKGEYPPNYHSVWQEVFCILKCPLVKNTGNAIVLTRMNTGNSYLSTQKTHVSSTAMFMWGLSAAFFCYQFLIRVAPATMISELMAYLDIQASAIGFMNSWYYRGYAFFLLPAGIMLDRFGVRVPVTLAALCCSTGCFIFATFQNVELMSLGRFLMGAGSTFAFLSCVKTIQLWFPEDRMTRFIGLSALMGTAGATFAGQPIAIANMAFGWQSVMYVLTIVGLSCATLFYLFVRGRQGKSHVTPPPHVPCDLRGYPHSVHC